MNKITFLTKLNSIIKLINPVENIESFEHLQHVANNTEIYTLVQKDFFIHLPKIIIEHSINNIKGDFVEIGVWKGGVAIYLRKIMEILDSDNKLILIDTFSGFNIESIRHSKDLKALKIFSKLSIKSMPTIDNLLALFIKAGYLINNRIQIIESAIEDVKKNQIPDNISLLHIDVDFYEPTFESLKKMYPKLNKGGIVIIDDYGVDEFNCKNAVDDYRQKYLITSPIIMITNFIAYWIK